MRMPSMPPPTSKDPAAAPAEPLVSVDVSRHAPPAPTAPASPAAPAWPHADPALPGGSVETASGRRSPWRPWAFALAYLLLGAVLLPAFRYQINPDGVSYIAVARKYAAGDFAHAVNAYWGPLYCWLLAPLLKAGIDPLLAAKIVSLLTGLPALFGVWRVARNLGVPEPRAAAVTATAVPILLYLAYAFITPDLLSVSLVLLYVAHVSRPDLLLSGRAAVVTGLLGGIGYLAKAYVMWFFAGHLLVVTAVWLLARPAPPRAVLRHAALALAAFAAVAGPWFAALSAKYGHFTAGSSGSFNHAILGPTGATGIPQHVLGFIPPPNPTAPSGWEDPTYIPVATWNPLASKANLAHQLRITGANAENVLVILKWYSLLLGGAIVGGLLLCRGPLDPRPLRPLSVVMAAVLIYPVGYLFVFLENRYLAPPVLLLLPVGCLLLSAAQPQILTPARLRLALAVFCLTVLSRPAIHLVTDRGAGRPLYDQAARLAPLIPPGARIASDTHWSDALAIGFYRDAVYYGETRPADTAAQVEQSLRQHRIEYFLVWGDRIEYPFLKAWTRLTPQDPADPTVYRAP